MQNEPVLCFSEYPGSKYQHSNCRNHTNQILHRSRRHAFHNNNPAEIYIMVYRVKLIYHQILFRYDTDRVEDRGKVHP